MSQCPSCHGSLEDDFGLVTCPSCGESVFIEIEGEPKETGAVGPSFLPQVDPEEEASPSEELSNILVDEVTRNLDLNVEASVPESVLDDFDEDATEVIAAPAPASGDLSEVADFGNSNESLAQEGSLRFNIFISGIDTAFIREQVKEVMEDKRFLWDAEALIAGVNQGGLKVLGVSSVKAAVFIQKVKNLPVSLAWEQYDIHQV